MADVSPRSSPLRDVTFLVAKRPSAAMSEEKRQLFAGYGAVLSYGTVYYAVLGGSNF